MTSPNAPLHTSGAAATAAQPPTSAGGSVAPPHTNATSCGGVSDSTLQTCFYFTVFFSNNPPIFHSNRIASDLLGVDASSTSSASLAAPCCGGRGQRGGPCGATAADHGFSGASASASSACDVCSHCQQRRWRHVFCDPADRRGTPGSLTTGTRSISSSHALSCDSDGKQRGDVSWLDGVPVGDFKGAAAAMDEVPQQTLQTVAFPTAFGGGGGGGGGGGCPLPVRRLRPSSRRGSQSAPPQQQQQPAALDTRSPSSSSQISTVPPAAAAATTTTTSVGGVGLHGLAAAQQPEGKSQEKQTRRGSSRDAAPRSFASGKPQLPLLDLPGSAASAGCGAGATNAALYTYSNNFSSNAIFNISPNTLPLTTTTTTVNSDATTAAADAAAATTAAAVTTAAARVAADVDDSVATRGGAEAKAALADGTGASATALPARFQPTFPLVTWEDDDVRASAGQHGKAAAVAGQPASGASHPLDDGTAAPVAAPAAATKESAAAAAAATAPAPALVPVGAAVRSRRPRPKVSGAPVQALAKEDATQQQQPQRNLSVENTVQPRPTAAVSPAAAAVAAAHGGAETDARRLGLASSTCLPQPKAPLSAAPQQLTETHAASSPLAARQPTAAPSPSAASAAAAESVVTVTPPPVVRGEGPPWNMRVEEVRSAKGELRCYRVILAVSFAALITSHTGLMHTMQTRNAATALVLTCPPSGIHYRFLLHHMDVLRSVLNRTTEFAIRTVQRFFGLLFSPTQKPKGTQQQVLKGISGRLEAHPEAVETYRCVKAELASALRLLCPVPLLSPSASEWVMPVLLQSSLVPARARSGGAGGGIGSAAPARAAAGGRSAMAWLGGRSPAASAPKAHGGSAADGGGAAGNDARRPPALSEVLYEATAYVCDYSEGFASAFVCGVLSLLEDGVRQRRVHTPVASTEEGGGTAAGTAALNGEAPRGHSMSIASATATRDASMTTYPGTFPASGGSGSSIGATPEWLAPYDAYFHSLTATAGCCDVALGAMAGGRGEEGNVVEAGRSGEWVQLRKPAKAHPQANQAMCTRAGAGRARDRRPQSSDDEDDDDEVYDVGLQARVSPSTVSSVTPVLSPLTVDVESRSPSARLPRGRPLQGHALTTGALQLTLGGSLAAQNRSAHTSLTNMPTAAAMTPSLSTAQLYNVSAETSVTSHAVSAMTSVVAAPLLESVAPAGTPATATGSAGLQSSASLSGAAGRPVRTPRCAGETSTPAPTAAGGGPLPPPTPPPPPTPSAGKDDEYVLHRGRLGRVVIFTQDAALARRLLLMAAFLWCDSSGEAGRGLASRLAATATAGGNSGGGGSTSGSGSGRAAHSRDGGHGVRHVTGGVPGAVPCQEAQRMYETAVAAVVDSADYASVPIQWLPEEFSESRLASLCSRFSPENTLLVVVPRQLQCRRVRLRKHVAGTTVLVEQQAGREARIRSPAFPFRCAVARQTVLLPDPTVATLLREACSLHNCSRGTVDFADVFERMVEWLYWQSAAAVLKKRDTHTPAMMAAAAAEAEATSRSAAEEEAFNAAGLSRNGSADLLWPSRSVSAVGSRTTTPTSRTPAMAVHRPQYQFNGDGNAGGLLRRHNTASSSSTSAAPSSPIAAAAISRSWAADSVEDVLLPGSRGRASAAWAYASTGTPTPRGAAAIVGSHRTNLTSASTTAMMNDGGSGGNAGTSTLLVSHGLVQPPSAFVTASPTVRTPPQKSSSLRFLNWFRSSPTSATSAASHHHPILSPTTLSQLSAEEGGQLPRLLIEDDELLPV